MSSGEAAHPPRAAVPAASLNTNPWLAREDPELVIRSMWEKVSHKPPLTFLSGHPFEAAGREKHGISQGAC